jgi:hypothetical protein
MLRGTRKAAQQLARSRGTTSAARPLLFSNPGHGLSTQVHTDEQSHGHQKSQSGFSFSPSQYAAGAVFSAFGAAYGYHFYQSYQRHQSKLAWDQLGQSEKARILKLENNIKTRENNLVILEKHFTDFLNDINLSKDEQKTFLIILRLDGFKILEDSNLYEKMFNNPTPAAPYTVISDWILTAYHSPPGLKWEGGELGELVQAYKLLEISEAELNKPNFDYHKVVREEAYRHYFAKLDEYRVTKMAEAEGRPNSMRRRV